MIDSGFAGWIHSEGLNQACEADEKQIDLTYSRFRVDEVHPSSDRELTGNGTAVSSIESYVPHLPKKCCIT
jgi:hypothetical protein